MDNRQDSAGLSKHWNGIEKKGENDASSVEMYGEDANQCGLASGRKSGYGSWEKCLDTPADKSRRDVFGLAKVLAFMLGLRKHALLYQAGLEGGLFQLQDHSGSAY